MSNSPPNNRVVKRLKPFPPYASQQRVVLAKKVLSNPIILPLLPRTFFLELALTVPFEEPLSATRRYRNGPPTYRRSSSSVTQRLLVKPGKSCHAHRDPILICQQHRRGPKGSFNRTNSGSKGRRGDRINVTPSKRLGRVDPPSGSSGVSSTSVLSSGMVSNVSYEQRGERPTGDSTNRHQTDRNEPRGARDEKYDRDELRSGN
jgi:hypothetical protein